MKISTRGRYGLRALVDLAAQEDNKSVNLKSISERQGISENYLEQLFSALKKAGIVKSVRGAQGGYHLNHDPCDISVGEVLKVLEGSLYPVDCLAGKENNNCGAGSCDSCVTKGVWEKVYNSMTGVLDGISLEDLVNDYKNIINLNDE